MSEVLKSFDFLLKEDGPAAIVLKQWLKPVGGDIIFPPTYAAPSQKRGDPPVYNIDRFRAELQSYGKRSRSWVKSRRSWTQSVQSKAENIRVCHRQHSLPSESD